MKKLQEATGKRSVEPSRSKGPREWNSAPSPFGAFIRRNPRNLREMFPHGARFLRHAHMSTNIETPSITNQPMKYELSSPTSRALR